MKPSKIILIVVALAAPVVGFRALPIREWFIIHSKSTCVG